MRDEISPTAGGRRREQSPTASCYYMAAEVENTANQRCHPAWYDGTDSAVPATTAQRISRRPLKKEQHHKTKRLLASQTMHAHHFIFLCTHHSICIHTAWIRIHTVHILMHTLNHHCTYTLCIHTHMHTHPYAHTPICIHTYMHTHHSIYTHTP